MYVEALNAEFCWAIMVYVANLNLQQFLKDENIHKLKFEAWLRIGKFTLVFKLIEIFWSSTNKLVLPLKPCKKNQMIIKIWICHKQN